MCGIVGVFAASGSRPSFDRAVVERARDSMAHRGPDGAGYWDGGNVIFAHRRLAVIDRSVDAAQPFCFGDAHRGGVLVYNGELYNDHELRERLTRAGTRFRTGSDSETIAAALTQWGEKAIGLLRGMYALAWYDRATGRVLLARDRLGIKPLYYTRRVLQGRMQVIFASEPRVVAEMCDTAGDSPRADMAVVSSYLTSIRTTLGERTLIENVRTLLPGQALEFDCASGALSVRESQLRVCDWPEERGSNIGEVLEDSVHRHLRSDVPSCCLLSGGLDSSIVCEIVRRKGDEGAVLKTYCAGARGEEEDGDFSYARMMAAYIGAAHQRAEIDCGTFAQRWREMIARTGMPLSTPNEVAINEVARVLRRQGNVVALSGEGADELFGGYLAPMEAAAKYVEVGRSGQRAATPGLFHINNAAWVGMEAKGAVFNEPIWRRLEGDCAMVEEYESAFADVAGELPESGELQAHLRFMRRINLTGLLQRLDSAMMLEGVEGRTPFADSRVASVAERLPMSEKFALTDPLDEWGRTKRCLRRDFSVRLPRAIVKREKASFPLPFQRWLPHMGGVLEASSWSREVFTQASRKVVGSESERFWQLAWPMFNLAEWGRTWWS